MNHSYIDPDELGAALRWQLEMGIDCALSDHPETDSPIQPVQIIAKQAGPTSVSASLPDWNQKQPTPSVSQKPAAETVLVQNQPDMPSVSSNILELIWLYNFQSHCRIVASHCNWSKVRQKNRRVLDSVSKGLGDLKGRPYFT